MESKKEQFEREETEEFLRVQGKLKCPKCGDDNCTHLTEDYEIRCCVCGYNNDMPL